MPFLSLRSSLCFAGMMAIAAAHDGPARAGVRPFSLRPVVKMGEPAPGVPGSIVSGPFICPVIDAQGRAAFFAFITNPNRVALLAERDGALSLVGAEGQPAPGTAGAVFGAIAASFFTPSNIGMDLAGNIYFGATLAGGDVVDCDQDGFPENDTAIYTNRTGELTLLVRENDHVPGFDPNVTYDQLVTAMQVSPFGVFGAFFVLKSGQCPFFGSAPNISMLDQGKGLERFILAGDKAPVPQTVFLGPAWNLKYHPLQDGVLCFNSGIQGPGVTSLNDAVLVTSDHDHLFLKAREGDPVPRSNGLFLGSNLGDFRSGLRGDIYAWVSSLVDAVGTPFAGLALVASDQNATLHTIALRNEQAPGFPDGAGFQTLGGSDGSSSPFPIAVSDDGHLLFHATVFSTNGVTDNDNNALFRADLNGSVSLLLREGDQAPGLPSGVRFGHLGTEFLLPFGMLAGNRAGNAAFVAFLHGPGFDPPLANGLFFYEAQGGAIRKVIATNDVIDLSGGAGTDLRTVARVARFNFDHLLRAFYAPVLNESNQFPLALAFTDGSSAVFVAEPIPISIPGDVTGDGVVNANDLLAVLNQWGPCPSLPQSCPADISPPPNGDGVVNVNDLLMVLKNWG